MNNKADSSNPARGRIHLIAGACALGVGIGVARYLAGRPQPPAGDPTVVDIAALPPGKLQTLEWLGHTVWILKRSPAELAALVEHESELIDPASEHSLQPASCRNRHRSIRPEIFVAIGQCTHQGCTPQLRVGAGIESQFLCPCHNSKYDLAGRVFRAGPAPVNLIIPEYRFENSDRLAIGVA